MFSISTSVRRDDVCLFNKWWINRKKAHIQYNQNGKKNNKFQLEASTKYIYYTILTFKINPWVYFSKMDFSLLLWLLLLFYITPACFHCKFYILFHALYIVYVLQFFFLLILYEEGYIAMWITLCNVPKNCLK